MEKFFPLFLGNPDAGIGHGKAQMRVRITSRNRNHDLPSIRQFYGICEEVDQNLPQAGGVALNGNRHVESDAMIELQTLLRCGDGNDVNRRLHTAPQVDRNTFQLQLPGLDLREIQNIADQCQECVAARPDRLQILSAVGAGGIVLEELGHPEDRVERRPNLVAHVGEKLALGEIGTLGPVAGFDELTDQTLALGDVWIASISRTTRPFSNSGSPKHRTQILRLFAVTKGSFKSNDFTNLIAKSIASKSGG